MTPATPSSSARSIQRYSGATRKSVSWAAVAARMTAMSRASAQPAGPLHGQPFAVTRSAQAELVCVKLRRSGDRKLVYRQRHACPSAYRVALGEVLKVLLLDDPAAVIERNLSSASNLPAFPSNTASASLSVSMVHSNSCSSVSHEIDITARLPSASISKATVLDSRDGKRLSMWPRPV